MKSVLSPLVFLLCLACARPSALDDARRAYNEGRGEAALDLLAKASREHPEDSSLRAEYFRLRDTIAGQWLRSSLPPGR